MQLPSLKRSSLVAGAALLAALSMTAAHAQNSQPGAQQQSQDKNAAQKPSTSTAGGGVAPDQSGQKGPGTPGKTDVAIEEKKHAVIEREPWTFSGMFGYFDQQQLRRGYKVYKTVCANCHNMRLLSFRNLGQPGGPAFPKEVVEQIASETQIPDPSAGEGQTRPGRPADNFQWIFKNEKEAASTLGAVPPDLSLITKARAAVREVSFYSFPFVMLKDLATQYQEQGSDYVHALLMGYKDPPPGKKVPEGLHYNTVMPGNLIAMAQPLTDGVVEYEDGTPNTQDQMARDVTAFLSWAAEPHLMERKRFGLWVLVYLGVVVVLLYLSKQALWRNKAH
jgi:cytochrome c1